jgi:hypothetical protein
VRVLAMVGELHKRGYQRLRIMPYFYATGAWRCSIAPVVFFYRNHGAIHVEPNGTDGQEATMVARYTSAADNHYFDWDDATTDNARSLADKFVERFPLLSDIGRGWDYPYAGWYLRLLDYAERGWIPYVFADYESTRSRDCTCRTCALPNGSRQARRRRFCRSRLQGSSSKTTAGELSFTGLRGHSAAFRAVPSRKDHLKP